MAKMRNLISLPAGGASQANVDKSLSQATAEIKEVVYKSVGGLDVELNKTASTTANGTLVVEPSDGKDVMEKATVTVAIPLEANKTVTIDASQYDSPVEITPTSGNTAMQKATVTVSNTPIIESNKAATIDVSQYSEAVEVTPSSNKDAMAKATVTLTNIPDIESSKTATIDVSSYSEPVEVSPTEGKDAMAKTVVSLSNIPVSGASAYYWGYYYLPIDVSPASDSSLESISQLKLFGCNPPEIVTIEQAASLISGTLTNWTRISDSQFKIELSTGTEMLFTRNSEQDLSFW